MENPPRATLDARKPSGLIDNLARCAALLGVAFPLLLIVVVQKLGQTPFLAFAFLGLTALQLMLGPTLLEIALTIPAGALYCAVYFWLGGSLPGDALFRVVGVASFVGVGSLLAMAARILWADREGQPRRLQALLVGITPIVFLAYMPVVFRIVSISTPYSLDRYLYAFDSRFGFEAGFVAGSWFAALPLLRTICAVVYLALPLAMTCVYIAAPDVPDEPGLVRTFLLTGVMGAFLFYVVPAAGPVYAFTSAYPDHLPAVNAGFLQPIHLEGVRLNAMPSLHTAWALLIFWRTRRNTFGVRAGAALFLFFTLLATLGLGEHYLIDLIVAVPFVVCVRAICMNRAGLTASRISAFAGCGLMVIAWLVLLRMGVLLRVSPSVAWALAALTVGCALWLDAGLCRYRFLLARKRLGEAMYAAARFARRRYYGRRRRVMVQFLS